MGTITGNTVQENVMQITEETLLCYQNDSIRARLIRNLADEMKDRGILSSAEHREFLLRLMEKNSLDPSVCTR